MSSFNEAKATIRSVEKQILESKANLNGIVQLLEFCEVRQITHCDFVVSMFLLLLLLLFFLLLLRCCGLFYVCFYETRVDSIQTKLFLPSTQNADARVEFFAINSLERAFAHVMRDMPDMLNARLVKSEQARARSAEPSSASTTQRAAVNGAFVWLHERYREFRHTLFAMVRNTHKPLAACDDDAQRRGVRVAAMHGIVRLIGAEGGATLVQTPDAAEHAFNVSMLRELLDVLVPLPRSATSNGVRRNVQRASDNDDDEDQGGDVRDDDNDDAAVDDSLLAIIDEFCAHYVEKFDDVKCYTLESLK